MSEDDERPARRVRKTASKRGATKKKAASRASGSRKVGTRKTASKKTSASRRGRPAAARSGATAPTGSGATARAGSGAAPSSRRGSAAAREAVVVAGMRTPFARAGGVFEPLGAADLGRIVMIETLARCGLDGERIDEVVFGCGGMPADAANPTRVAALRAGLPHRVPAYTVQRNCASGMEAVAQAAMLVESGRADVVLCGGMESMSGYPVELPRSFRRKLGAMARAKSPVARAAALAAFRPADLKPVFGLQVGLSDPTCGLTMGETAEVLARELGIDRAEQDEYALASHARASAARERLAEEIEPVVVPESRKVVEKDDAVREQQSIEALAKLRPIFDRAHGSVTAGNACGVTDGACGLVVAERSWAEEHAGSLGERAPLARIVGWATAGVDPRRMGLGPAAALPAALAGASWSLEELGLVEINEAFAVQVLAVLRVMADEELRQRHVAPSFAGGEMPPDSAFGEIARDRLNVNGGAIALGHPVGVSGARLVLTLAMEMRRRAVARGAATLCVGGGQGMAVLLEALS